MCDSCDTCKNERKCRCSGCQGQFCKHAVILDFWGCHCLDCYRNKPGIIAESQIGPLLRVFGFEGNEYDRLANLCFNPLQHNSAAPFSRHKQKPQHSPFEGLQEYSQLEQKPWPQACVPSAVREKIYNDLTRGHRLRTALNSRLGLFSPIATYLGDNIFLGGTLASEQQVRDFTAILQQHFLTNTDYDHQFSGFVMVPKSDLSIIEVAILEDFHFGLIGDRASSCSGARYLEGKRIPQFYRTMLPPSIVQYIEHIVQSDDDLEFDKDSILLAAYNILTYLARGNIVWIHCKSGMGRSFMFALLIKTLLTQQIRPMGGSYNLALLVIKQSRCIKKKRTIVQNDPLRLVHVLDLAHAFFRIFEKIPDASSKLLDSLAQPTK